MIRAACWALPHAERAERELEWTAEAQAVAEDTDVHLPGLRAVWFALSLLLHARATRGTHAAPAQPTHHRTIRDIIPGHVDSVQIIAFVVATFAEVVLGAAPSSASPPSPPSPPGIGGGEGVTGAVGGFVLGWPWWASLSVAFAWPLAYICRLACRYRLLSKALDKVAPDHVPEIAAFINGDQAAAAPAPEHPRNAPARRR
ncbi:hypothetical protein ACGFRG_07015 [Streptomyces sp. NPDC048696]|uniref:hypothetical protein n=1 Tax=Streptomyces sp. NPDC048696 TaxID=3365585 RepID=UPI0037127ABB